MFLNGVEIKKKDIQKRLDIMEEILKSYIPEINNEQKDT